MPSPRRIRVLAIAAVGTCILFLFYSSSSTSSSIQPVRDASIQDFYHKTMRAMDHGARRAGQAVVNTETGSKAGQIPADRDADGDIDEDDAHTVQQTAERLKAAEQKAKDSANSKAGAKPDPPSKVIGMGSSSQGQDKSAKLAAGEGAGADTVGRTGALGGGDDAQQPVKMTEKKRAEAELESILKKAPMIIFSKTYCPHSKRAKGILLEKYNINPDPYVVELDEHPLGPSLQDALEDLTGRRTVPNIMINGVSLGGADSIVALDIDDKLSSTISSFGNKKLTVSERFVSSS